MLHKDLEVYRKRAEEKLQRRPPAPDNNGATHIHYELEVQNVELEMQNDELRTSHSALEESHHNYADLYDFAPVGYVTFDAQGFIRESNLTAADMLEMSRAYLMNRLFKQYIVAEDMPIYLDHLMRVCRDGLRHTCELRLENKAAAYVQLESIPATHSRGGLCCRTTMIDITARKRAELAAQQSQTQFQLLVDGVEDYAIFMIGNDGNIMSWNVGAQRMLRYREHEIVGRSFAAIFTHKEVDADAPQKVLTRARSDGRSLDERWYARKDGSPFWANGVVTCLRDARGTVLGYAMVLRDMTLYKRYEEERERMLHELEGGNERLQAVLQQMPAAVVMVNPAGKVLLQNRLVEEIVGSLSGQTLEAWAPEHPFHRADGSVYGVHEWPLARSSRTGEVVVGEEMHYHWRNEKSGTLVVASAPLRNQQGEIVAAVATFSDITAKRRAEGELVVARKLESIGMLAGGIAHDFNNVLTIILGNINIASLSPEHSAEALSAAETACLQASYLTKRLLTFSEGGAPIKTRAPLTKVLNNASEFVAKHTAVRCEFDIAADLWQADYDAGQVRQVIRNLVFNAQEAMPRDGVIHITAKNVLVSEPDGPPVAPGRYIKIGIRDEGTGIARTQLGKIFDPFYTTKPKASGLGLTAAYWIVQKHQGHLAIESEVGVGTQAWLYLPAAFIEPASKTSSVGPVGRILVMDDEPTIRHFAERVLKHLDYEVVTVNDGAAAVTEYRAARDGGRPFALVILDLIVPGGKGGKETMVELRALDPDVCAIVSSGYSSDPVMARFREFGFYSSLGKPYDTVELCRTVTEVLAQRAAAHGIPPQ